MSVYKWFLIGGATLFIYKTVIRKVYRKIKSAYELYEEKEEMLQKALEQIDRYPEWRQQSIDIQAEFLEKIQSLSDNQKECVERLERIEESNRKRELKWLQVLIPENALKKVIQKWFIGVKDLLDDGKVNGSQENQNN